MPQETISQRIKILIKALDLNAKSFSEKYGVNESTTRGYIDRGSVPNAEYIATLSRSIENLNIQWLLLGEGDMFLDGVAEPRAVYNTTGRKGKAADTSSEATPTNQELAALRKENELLRSQLADKELIIQLLRDKFHQI
jgi:DNA-binding transcriptional regulator YiaG